MYKVKIIYPDGTTEIEPEEYETKEEAQDGANYAESCYKSGGEIFEMSNPGDYPNRHDKIKTKIIKV